MKSKLVGVVFAAWIVIEILAFMFVVHAVGLLAATALTVGTSLLGLADVKRLLAYLRGRVGRLKGQSESGAMLDGALQALASLLLILPGFASDFLGLALKSPSIRQNLAQRIHARGPAADPRVIDLDPREWRHVSRSRGARRRTAE